MKGSAASKASPRKHRKSRRAGESGAERPSLSWTVDVVGPKISGRADASRATGPLANFDDLNRRIVAMLQLDGRRSYASIARALEISEGAVRARVNQLRRDNHLRFIAVVDPVELGYTSWGMLGITVTAGTSPHQLARYFTAQPEVTYVMVVAAKYDLLVEICCQKTTELGEFLERHCHSSGKIAAVEMMVGLRLYKWFAPVPGAAPGAGPME